MPNLYNTSWQDHEPPPTSGAIVTRDDARKVLDPYLDAARDATDDRIRVDTVRIGRGKSRPAAETTAYRNALVVALGLLGLPGDLI